MDAVYSSKREQKTKHSTLCETPKWQPSPEELSANPHTDTSHSHHHTLNVHAFLLPKMGIFKTRI